MVWLICFTDDLNLFRELKWIEKVKWEVRKKKEVNKYKLAGTGWSGRILEPLNHMICRFLRFSFPVCFLYLRSFNLLGLNFIMFVSS